jgi:NAD(P)-dependent dehydrogenase (short-subunit alcohol dehydrogenase family)
LETKIRVNAIDPGPLRTALRANAFPGEIPSTVAAPETVMMNYLYLMGPESREVSGQVFHCQ